ncbi:MAG: aldo/keto reductase [Spirochaetaceae bacterium]|jgi:predicted aldo/keto reductase-like oxidoreductase|nr:aldo/keto reductase [Spirochaetaceae bacterium]
MAQITIGKTGVQVEQNGFGALPIQRISVDEAVSLLRKAYHGGINFFDSARGYTDSEEKLGKAFGGTGKNIFIATKTPAGKAEQFWEDLETSLRLLKTDHIDLYQFHNPLFCPKPGDPGGLYDAMVQAKKQGKIRFIGITNHRLNIAWEAIESGLYDTLQFPLSYLSAEKDLALVTACKERGMGFIAMKALSGGLITNSAAACAWMTRFENVIPIWGVQRERELDEFISYIKNPPVLTKEMLSFIERDRDGLRGTFCRGCGYCMPCPQGIVINMCARASLLLRRAPLEMLMSERGQEMMKKVENCIHCGQCSAKCPYGLDPPALLQKNYQDYQEILAGKLL